MPSSPDKEIILIIDDSEENRYTFSRYLRQGDFEVWTADSGEEGLALAGKNPSLIMLDIQLPDTSGYEVCRRLKSDPGTASIPVLHTSANFTKTNDRVVGLDGGADGYLTQPIDAHELTATIRSLLRVRAAEQAAKHLASQWKTTFDSIRDGLCVTNAAGEIERFNGAFTALMPESITARPGQPLAPLLEKLREAGTPEAPHDLMIRQRWYRVTSDPIHDDTGRVVGHAWVFSDIHSIREAELQLKNLNQELDQRVSQRTASLQDAVHQLEQFSYAVSHDLRAPLRAMQGYSNALLEDYLAALPAEAAEYLQRIAANATRLDRMIVDVLTFSRASQARPTLEPISLRTCVGDIIEHYPGLKPPQAEVTIDLPHDVTANDSALNQALSNLLGNSIKFVAPGVVPHIRIWSEARDGQIRIWVEDNGIGIAPEHQGRLFGMFERLRPASTYEGTGVGLAIARKVVERMNGTIGVESDGVNGSKFWIQLPASPDSAKFQ